MAGYNCASCGTTKVKTKIEVCASCRREAERATPAELANLDAEAARPSTIIATHLKQTAVLQRRIQNAIDNPETLLCKSCGENPRTVEQVNIDAVSEWHVRYAKVIASVIPTWTKLNQSGEEAANEMTRDEMTDLFCSWFTRLPASAQHELHQRLARIINDTAHMKVG